MLEFHFFPVERPQLFDLDDAPLPCQGRHSHMVNIVEWLLVGYQSYKLYFGYLTPKIVQNVEVLSSEGHSNHRVEERFDWEFHQSVVVEAAKACYTG